VASGAGISTKAGLHFSNFLKSHPPYFSERTHHPFLRNS
jgi:hypothetical protein